MMVVLRNPIIFTVRPATVGPTKLPRAKAESQIPAKFNKQITKGRGIFELSHPPDIMRCVLVSSGKPISITRFCARLKVEHTSAEYPKAASAIMAW